MRSPSWSLRLRYALAIATGAFLLFQVQPLLGQAILPRFGGAAGVWTACLLFFQTLLLLGYAYAHGLSRLPPRRQALVHAGLLALSLLFLPILPGAETNPAEGRLPVFRILWLLTTCVGVPYVLLAATGPLLQSWFNRETNAAPYRFYALSNAASLLGLLTYPFLVQPSLDLPGQSLAWSLGYGLFVVSILACAAGFLKFGRGGIGASGFGAAGGDSSPGAEDAARDAKAGAPPVPLTSSRADIFFWVAFPAAASALLLGITNQVTSEVAAVPFLWVLPLALYLVTFIVSFERPRWYRRRLLAPLLGICLLANTPVVGILFHPHWWQPILIGSITLFVAAWTCHGELVRLLPHPSRLTSYYLTIAAGGALGGAFVGLAAPLLFPGYWEAPIALFAALLLFLAAIHRDPASPFRGGRPVRAWGFITLGVGLIGPALLSVPLLQYWNFGIRERNFYGVILIADRDAGTPQARRLLMHGGTLHGFQYLDPDRRRTPTSYFGAESGIAVALENHPGRAAGTPLRVGVVGLGAGTIAAWGRPGDRFFFYELDPAVARAAREHFTFLADSPATVEVVVGDGRLALERDRGSAPLFDVLAVDAFSGGSIPTHLLTRECFESYRDRLRPDGVLAVHVSNKYLDLTPVVRAAARSLGMEAIRIYQAADPAKGRDSNMWVLLSSNRAFLESPEVQSRVTPWNPTGKEVAWTDRNTSLMKVLR